MQQAVLNENLQFCCPECGEPEPQDSNFYDYKQDYICSWKYICKCGEEVQVIS